MTNRRACGSCGRDYFRSAATEGEDVCRSCWLLSLMTPMGRWVKDAACASVGGDAWFAREGGGYDKEYDMARAICHRCPVREECLDWAVRNNIPSGMWGGLSPHQRRPLVRKYRASQQKEAS